MRSFLEKLAVVSVFSTPLLCGALPILLGLHKSKALRGFLIVYLMWGFVIDRHRSTRGGRPIQSIRSSTIWKLFRSYFSMQIVQEEQVDPKRKYVIGVHPHGVLSVSGFGAFMSDNPEVFPGLDYRVLTVDQNFLVPFWRDVVLSWGLVSASAESVRYLLSRGISVVVVVGGAEEALNSRPKSFDITLNKRFGFVRLALENGADLIPVFCFGENDVFKQLVPNPPGSFVRKLQDRLLSIFGYSLPLVHGRGASFLPFRRPVTVVAGAPINVPHIPNPTASDIQHWHSVYKEALEAIYNSHKDEFYSSPHQGFQIVDTGEKKLLKLERKYPSPNL